MIDKATDNPIGKVIVTGLAIAGVIALGLALLVLPFLLWPDWMHSAPLVIHLKLFWWGYIPALVPALLVALQGFYLVTLKSHAINEELGKVSQDSGYQSERRERTDLGTARTQMQRQQVVYFMPSTIAAFYAVYSCSLAIVAVTLFVICCDTPQSFKAFIASIGPPYAATTETTAPNTTPGQAATAGQPAIADHAAPAIGGPPQVSSVPACGTDRDDYFTAFRLGAAGAFLYTLIALGLRTYQRDITGPAAIWALTQLVLGPLLAATCAYFLLPKVSENNPMSFSAVFFFAGLAPRTIIDWIDATVRRIYLQQTVSPVSRRSLPLSTLRSITPKIEGRLAEEGIESVDTLAMANPIKLLRDTPYDPRQVLSWMDEALLVVALPDHWSKLESLGISGAIDLAWYALDDDSAAPATRPFIPPGAQPLPGVLPPAPVPSGNPEIPPEIKKFAAEIKLDEQFLWDAALRLVYDDQLELVWAMYESNG